MLVEKKNTLIFLFFKKIIERYNRNPKIKAYEDIQEIVFNIEAEKFQITYHRENSKIAASTREFAKPSNWNDKSNTWTWNNDLHQAYLVILKNKN
jgi:hypothetical protein